MAGLRRMVRAFSGSPVPESTLEEVLQRASRPPSAGNTQGWTAVVLVGPTETDRFWSATTTADWRARSSRWPGLGRAPVVVSVFADPAAYVARYAEPDKADERLGGAEDEWPIPYWFVDAGFALLLLLLAATDAGLGACLLGNFRGEEALRGALGVPEGRRYVGAVILGEPGEGDRASASTRRPRRDLGDIFRRGSW